MKKITCYDIYNKPIEVDVKDLLFRPSVYGLLIEDNKVLLSKQLDGYDFPGGGIDANETINEALIREYFEETGLHIETGKLITCEQNFYYSRDKKAFNSILLYYLVKKVGGELSIDNVTDAEKKYFNIGMPEWIDVRKTKGLRFYNSVDSLAVIQQGLQLI